MRYYKSPRVAATGALLLALMLLSPLLKVQAQDMFSVGPAFHYNFGDKKPKVSWGIEASVWWYENQFPISANLGFDRRKGNSVLYSQAQTGVGIAGVSAGPYLQFSKEDGAVTLGLQTDYWVNYIAGINYRIRYGNGEKQKALGLYFKVPIGIGIEADADDDGDWDWD